MLWKVGDVMQKCENTFCIYQEDGACLLEQISLDEGGRCTECTLINLEKETVEKAKKKTLFTVV